MKILITNNHLRDFGGSELVTLEIAEALQHHDVTIYSPTLGIKTDLNVTSNKPNPDDFDVLWIHHNMIVYEGFRKRRGQKIIFNHMSSYVGLEFPLFAEWENIIANHILCNSEETRAVLNHKGLKNVELFQNPAPKCFEIGLNPKHPLIITNHVAPELLAALPPNCRKIGRSFDLQKRIDPQDIAEAQYVICNGKSVIYALKAGVPVYLYDHFGGCGWLTENNFLRAEMFNFSGRGFSTKTTEQIKEELKHVPNPVPCPDRFKLEKVLCTLLG